MAVKFKVTDTKTVLLQLLICLMTFYAVYYITGSMLFGAFRLETYDALIPFDFKTGASFASSKYIVNLVSMEMTYFVSGLLFAGVVKDWVWDYAITVTLIHIAVTSTVMAEFPLVWHWWLALGGALLIMICSGHLLVHFAFQDNLIYPLLDDF
ncbi:transmembrane protein 244 isoform X3 [Scyliorhinus canicula]|uniref:transmembrane protein 244 isoform X3 n=1 Tax=Scyliorhinus canicula TaxID=7830 RepID=UPI0018F5C85A|nr:transmembrane protein 244 isoform X3 [Scyliorhinus canicula]